jgi:hypothetical protein
MDDFFSLLQNRFPFINKKNAGLIFCMISWRLNKFWNNIWLSRCEWERLNISQERLRSVIYFLRDFWILKYKKKAFSKKKSLLCNVYEITEGYLEMFESFEFYLKKFKYVDPLDFMLTYFKIHKNKPKFYMFKIDWLHYRVSKIWRFTWKVYSCESNSIINPLTLLT